MLPEKIFSSYNKQVSKRALHTLFRTKSSYLFFKTPSNTKYFGIRLQEGWKTWCLVQGIGGHYYGLQTDLDKQELGYSSFPETNAQEEPIPLEKTCPQGLPTLSGPVSVSSAQPTWNPLLTFDSLRRSLTIWTTPSRESSLRFLILFCTACDQNGGHEGAALYLFQFFLTGQARDRVVSKISGTTDLLDSQDLELLRSYPQVFHYLSGPFAADDVIMDAHQEVISFKQSSKMTELAFADDLWKKGYRCGNLFSEGLLKCHFITGLLPGFRTHVRNYHTENPQYSFRRLFIYIEGYGEPYRSSRSNAYITRAHATLLRKPNQAFLVSSTESDMDSSLHYADSGDVLAGRNGNPIGKLLEGRREANPSSLSPCLNQVNGQEPRSPSSPNTNHNHWTTQNEPEWENSNDPACILRNANYKVRVTMGLRSNSSRLTTAVLDTGAGLNLVHSKLLPFDWQDFVQARKTPRITDASRRPMDIKGIVPLYIHLERFKIRTWFLVCPSLGADAILGTSFIDRYIKAIYPGLRKVAFYRPPSIPIISSAPGPKANLNRAIISEDNESDKVR
ncbi:unnamed protein product [Agarophyton chilense]